MKASVKVLYSNHGRGDREGGQAHGEEAAEKRGKMGMNGLRRYGYKDGWIDRWSARRGVYLSLSESVMHIHTLCLISKVALPHM